MKARTGADRELLVFVFVAVVFEIPADRRLVSQIGFDELAGSRIFRRIPAICEADDDGFISCYESVSAVVVFRTGEVHPRVEESELMCFGKMNEESDADIVFPFKVRRLPVNRNRKSRRESLHEFENRVRLIGIEVPFLKVREAEFERVEQGFSQFQPVIMEKVRVVETSECQVIGHGSSVKLRVPRRWAHIGNGVGLVFGIDDGAVVESGGLDFRQRMKFRKDIEGLRFRCREKSGCQNME